MGALLPPSDLTIPNPGSNTARDVLSRAIGRLLREIRPLVREHAALAPAADVSSFDRLLVALLRDHPAPLASVLRRPNVGALVRTLRRPPSERDADILCELVGLVSFELAVLGELPFEVRLRRFPRRLLSMAGELAVDVPDATEVVLESGRMRMTRGGETHAIDLAALRDETFAVPPGSPWQLRRPFHAVDGLTSLALEDNNPNALDEAHPDKSGNAVDAGTATAAAWATSLRSAFALVATYLPDLRAEMDLYISQIVPVGVFDDQHLSASYREALGTIYLSLHPNPMTMTEALIHEFQHNKLNALFELDDVLENAFSPLYPSPVRPDPRPLHGVLLAVHAFLPIARLYERMRADGHPYAAHGGFGARFDAVVAINREGASVVLEHGVPTSIGAGLLDEIRRWDGHYRCGE
jgi:HEXXH motif-containing protein